MPGCQQLSSNQLVWNLNEIFTLPGQLFQYGFHFSAISIPFMPVNTTWTLKEIRNLCKEFLTFALPCLLFQKAQSLFSVTNTLWWTLWAGGRQVGRKQHQIRSWNFVTKNIFQRGEYFLMCVVERRNGIFLQDTNLISTLYNSGCCNWLSRLSKISLPKKTDQKSGISCSIVSSDSAPFVTCSQLWHLWSQLKQVIHAPWRPTTPCCLFPCTKMVKLFPFKGNKSWCSSWDRKTARTKSK